MSQYAESLRALAGECVLPVLSERRHRAGDGVVEAEVERLEIVDGHDGLLLDGEPGDDLTEIPVVVDDLAHREALMEALAAVRRGRRRDVRVVAPLARRSPSQRLAELIEERRQRLGQLGLGGGGRVPGLHAGARSHEDLLAMHPDEPPERAGDGGLVGRRVGVRHV